jgi:leucyl aminopeptidase (aminopeptidase T)
MGMNVDVIIAPMATNIAHSPLRTEALNSGVRVLVLVGINEEALASGLFDADFHELRVKCDKMADLLTGAKVARATTSRGTNITMSLEGREGQSQSGFAVKGVLAGPPSLEALCCPVEGTAEGSIICDVSLQGIPPELDFKGRLLSEPIELIVHEGFAREIRGGREARQFKELLESLNDPTVYTVAELGVGMNPNVKKFDGRVLDEAAVGSIHIGIGENWCFPGGSLKSSGHFDFIISNVTLELDGKAVLKDGKLLI